LVSEGSSDQILLRPIDWLLRKYLPADRFIPEGRWADLSKVPARHRSLDNKCRVALDLYPCEILFVHRDSDNRRKEDRVEEIRRALVPLDLNSLPWICVVPVRMTEAWFLFNEAAIRQAAGNPHGTVALTLPSLNRIESEPNAKKILHDMLRNASELNGRRQKKFRPDKAAHRLGELITDFSPLRQLPAFSALEEEVRRTVNAM
jgi:hypothetical protein